MTVRSPTPRPTTGRAAPDLPAPRFAAAWAAAVYALCTIVLAFPIFAGRYLATPHSDQYLVGYAFREFAAQSLRSGDGFPQWNPYLFGGVPYIAAMHGDIFYPTFLLRMVMPTDVAMSLGFAIHLFLAGIFTYGFLRAWGLAFFPALVGGLAYMLSGQIASLVSPGHDGKLFVSALLPLVLWMVLRGIRDGRAWAWGGLALSIGLAVLSPHPQLLQYLLLTAGAFALFVAFSAHDERGHLPRRLAVQRLALALGAVVLGGVIGAIQFLPVREYVDWSPRSGGRDYAYATSYSMPIEELFNTYLPQFTGILDRYWGRNGIHLHSEYLGVVPLMLAFGAIGSGTRRAFRLFMLGTLVVALLWALGGHTPFFHIIYNLVPGSKFFRAPSTIFYVVSFAVAVFAALGTERLLAGRMSTRYVLIWTGVAGAIALLMTVGGATALPEMVLSSIARDRMPENVSGFVGAYMQLVEANQGAVILGAWRSFLFVGLGAALIWAMTNRRIPARAAAWALVALIAVDLWSVVRTYWQFSPPASETYASNTALNAIRSAPQPGRVLVVPFGNPPAGIAPSDPVVDGCAGGTGGGTLMALGIRNVLGCHGNELGRYQQLGGKSQTTVYDLEGRLLTPAFWRHANVHYLLTNLPDSVMAGAHTQLGIAQPFTSMGASRTAAGSQLYLYRVPGENPLAWVAAAAVPATDEQALATVLDARFDPARAAIVDSSVAAREVSPAELAAVAGARATVTAYAPGTIDLELAQPAPENSVLVVSENYFPGWTATANGAAAPVARANLNLIGVMLPAGATTVQLRFADPAYATGKVVTLIAAVLALLILAVGGAMERRGRGRPGAVGA